MTKQEANFNDHNENEEHVCRLHLMTGNPLYSEFTVKRQLYKCLATLHEQTQKLIMIIRYSFIFDKVSWPEVCLLAICLDGKTNTRKRYSSENEETKKLKNKNRHYCYTSITQKIIQCKSFSGGGVNRIYKIEFLIYKVETELILALNWFFKVWV